MNIYIYICMYVCVYVGGMRGICRRGYNEVQGLDLSLGFGSRMF